MEHHLPLQEGDDILSGPPNVWSIEVCFGVSADKLQQASQLNVVLPQLAAVHRAAHQGPIVIGLWEKRNGQARLASSIPSSMLPERDTQLRLLQLELCGAACWLCGAAAGVSEERMRAITCFPVPTTTPVPFFAACWMKDLHLGAMLLLPVGSFTSMALQSAHKSIQLLVSTPLDWLCK